MEGIIYKTGGKSTIDYLEVSGLKLPAGGIFNVQLQNLSPDDVRTLGDNLPLDEEAGAKLARVFRLQDRLKDLDRVELIAYRVAQFTREEAAYWLSRTTSFGSSATLAFQLAAGRLGNRQATETIMDMTYTVDRTIGLASLASDEVLDVLQTAYDAIHAWFEKLTVNLRERMEPTEDA